MICDLIGLVAAHAMVIPPLEITWYPADAWVAAGIPYVLALYGLAFVAQRAEGLQHGTSPCMQRPGICPDPLKKTRELS